MDVGSGAGFNGLIASRLIGSSGRVIGFDITSERLKKAEVGAEAISATNVEFCEGLVVSLLLPDDFTDVVISNGVLNLITGKTETLREWLRILKPGGHLSSQKIMLPKFLHPISWF